MDLGNKMNMVLIRCFGSARAFSLGDLWRLPSQQALESSMDRSPPQTPPRREKLWSMNKTELLAEAVREGLCINPRWNLEEVRSIVREHRAELDTKSPEANLKGIGSMTLPQLREMAQSHNITVPEKATRGLLMRLIRGEVQDADETIVPFGRYKGWLYREISQGYLDWSVAETGVNPNSSDRGLRRRGGRELHALQR